MATNTRVRVKESQTGMIDLSAIQAKQAEETERLKARTADAAVQTEKLMGIRTEWKDALAKGDVDKLKILNADFESANQQAASFASDLSSIMASLLKGYEQMGLAIKLAEEFVPEETQIIANGENLVTKAKDDLAAAKAAKYWTTGGRLAAETQAAEAIKVAEAALEMAKTEAAKMRRSRIEHMSIDQGLQTQQLFTQQLTDIARGQIAELQEQVAAMQVNLDETIDDIKTSTDKLESLDKSLGELNSALVGLNEELTSYVENSADWVNCKERLLAKTTERDQVENDRNTQLLLTQEGARFLEFSRLQGTGLQQKLAMHKSWIELLQMGSRKRDVIYKAYLTFLRASTQQEGMSQIDEVATRTDQEMAETIAMKNQADRKNMLKRLHRAPEEVKALRDITEADVENQVAFEKEFLEALEDFHKNFGSARGYDDRGAHREQPAA